MNKIYCSKCNKHKKTKNPEMSYVFDKASVFFLICDKCDSNEEPIFKEEQSIERIKMFCLIKNLEKC